MRLIADLHTHTNVSDHAYSTLLENISYAKKHNMKAIALTNHAPDLPDAPLIYHFVNLKVIPEFVEDVQVFKGAEVNLIDYNGGLDIPDNLLKKLDWVIASFHSAACPAGNKQENTNAYIEAVKNPFVDLIGHCGQAEFPFEYEKLIKTAKEYDKLIEINEGSFASREGSDKNCPEILKLCKKYEVKITVNSDCHFAPSIGKFPRCLKMLEEIDFPENLVLNSNYEELIAYIKSKKNIKSKMKTA